MSSHLSRTSFKCTSDNWLQTKKTYDPTDIVKLTLLETVCAIHRILLIQSYAHVVHHRAHQSSSETKVSVTSLARCMCTQCENIFVVIISIRWQRKKNDFHYKLDLFREWNMRNGHSPDGKITIKFNRRENKI